MRPLTIFNDHAVLEGATPNLGSPEEEAAQPNTTPKKQTPTRSPTLLAAALSNEPNAPAVGSEHPGWMKVHPSCQVASMGHVPMSLGNLRQHCQSQSSSRRKAQCHWREEQWGGGPGNSSSASLQGSPVPVCWAEEDPHQEDLPKMPSLGLLGNS